MFEKILVPLDGSSLSEKALPHAVELARKFGSELILLRVVILPVRPEDVGMETMVPLDFPALEDKKTEQIQASLRRVKERLKADGVPVRLEVERGAPAAAIQKFVKREQVGLVVMSSHGRTGFSGWVYGSVAGKLLKALTCPVLLVRIPPKELSSD
ncbi:MAG: universal stress protein [Armatimonadetes bacterium]|nr:universal stress protein [Armatimonadota bacterium]